MATKLEHLDLEIAHFNNFKEYLPSYSSLCPTTLLKIAEMGLLQVSTAFEHALAQVSGHTVVSTDEADISDGSDAKLVSVRTSGYGRSYSAPVTNVSGKSGSLRVQVYERKQNKFYYFVIPWHAYCWIPKTSNIDIPFEMNGTPRRKNRCITNWWAYEVESFEMLSQIMLDKFSKR